MLPPLPGKRAVMDPAELMNENPFRLPTDDQIFRMREDERKDKEHSKDFNMSLKVWERSKKDVLSASERLREIVGRLLLHHHHDHAYVHTSVDSYVIKGYDLFIYLYFVIKGDEKILKLSDVVKAESDGKLWYASMIDFADGSVATVHTHIFTQYMISLHS